MYTCVYEREREGEKGGVAWRGKYRTSEIVMAYREKSSRFSLRERLLSYGKTRSLSRKWVRTNDKERTGQGGGGGG